MPEQINTYNPTLPEDPSVAAVWLTSADQRFLFERQADGLVFADNINDPPLITVDTE